MGDCVESLAEVKVDNIHGSPFVYPASHVIVESYQIGLILLNIQATCTTFTRRTLSEYSQRSTLHLFEACFQNVDCCATSYF